MSAPGFPMSARPQGLVPPAPNDPTAVIGSRVVAGLVDALLFFLVMLFVSPGPLSPLAEYAEKDDDLSQDEACELAEQNADADPFLCYAVGDRVYWLNQDDRPIQIAVEFGYVAVYILWQGLTGLTPGKLLLGLRTVRADGQAPGIGRSFLRTVLWIVDGFPYCLPLVGLILAVSSTGHRRLGDMAAGTFVVGKGDAGRPVVVPGLTAGGAAPASYPGAPTATAPYGTPAAGYPGAPFPQPGQPQAGAWGTPPSAPTTDWGTPPPTPAGPPVAPEPAAFPPSPSETATPDVPFGAGADPAGFEATAPTAPQPEPVAQPAPSDEPASSAPGEPSPETVAQVTEAAAADTAPAPQPEPTTEVPGEPTPETVSQATEAAAETPGETQQAATQQADSPYQPQWDAARGAYIQWDPNRSRWLQWDDTAKEWNPI